MQRWSIQVIFGDRSPSLSLLSVVVLLSFTLLAALSNRSPRPFTLGFAIVGWVYFILTFGSHFGRVDSYLLTHRLVEWSGQALHFDPLFDVDSTMSPPDSSLYASTSNSFDPKTHGIVEKLMAFKDIGHCLWTLILAGIGGLIGVWVQRPRAINKPKDQP